jgi:hypothetical protein
MSNFKPGDVVICVTTDDFHYYQNWKYPRLYGIYTIEIVLSDGAFTLNEIDNHHLDIIPMRNITDIKAFWSWHFKRIVGLTPKTALSEEEETEQLITLENSIA